VELKPPQEAAIGCHNDDELHRILAGAAKQRRRSLLPGHTRRQRTQHTVHALGIRAGRLGLLLRPA